MGRRKIAIQPILEERNRSVTFNKRRAGLFKKAYELGILCGAEVAIIVFSPTGKCFEFTSGNLDETLLRYSRMTAPPTERRGPEHYGGAIPHPALAQMEDGEEEEEDESDLEKPHVETPKPEVQEAPQYSQPHASVPLQADYIPAMMSPFFATQSHHGYAGSYLPHVAQSLRAQSMGMLPPTSDSYSMNHAPASSQAHEAAASPSTTATTLPSILRTATSGSLHKEGRAHRVTAQHPDLAMLRRGSAPALPTTSRQLISPTADAGAFTISDLLSYHRTAGETLEDESEVFEWPTYDRRSREPSDAGDAAAKRPSSVASVQREEHEGPEPAAPPEKRRRT